MCVRAQENADVNDIAIYSQVFRTRSFFARRFWLEQIGPTLPLLSFSSLNSQLCSIQCTNHVPGTQNTQQQHIGFVITKQTRHVQQRKMNALFFGCLRASCLNPIPGFGLRLCRPKLLARALVCSNFCLSCPCFLPQLAFLLSGWNKKKGKKRARFFPHTICREICPETFSAKMPNFCCFWSKVFGQKQNIREMDAPKKYK